MRYMRCKCQNVEAWTTDSFQDCDGCEKCQTTLSSNPNNHRPLIPHDFVAYPIKADQEGATETRCSRCHILKRKYEKERGES